RLAEDLGGPILELGCGSGRIAGPLARDGHRVYGLDLHRGMLREAMVRRERLPRRARARLSFFQGDLRQFALGMRFPLILCAFNTLQHLYLGDVFLEALATIRRHLAPGGRFVFDVLMPDLDWLLRDSSRRWARHRFRHPASGRSLIYSTNHDYDPVGQIAYVRIYYDPSPGETGPSRVVHLAHRQYFPQEVALLLTMAGFVVERREGDFEGRPLGPASESQVYVCTVAEGR
ncbi:MAG: class I SAM-dependent methyltransferase, partial [Lentisphaeria bacterium]|nr:class I SAM-dependent methyltransferase [Lentisphaeria bacterium]